MIQVQQGQRLNLTARMVSAAVASKIGQQPLNLAWTGSGFARLRYPTTPAGNDYSQAGLNVPGITPDADGSTDQRTTALIPTDAPLGKAIVVAAVSQRTQAGAVSQRTGSVELEIVPGVADTVQELVSVEVVLA